MERDVEQRADAEGIRRNLQAVNARIEAACGRSGRPREDVRLLLATKTVPPARIRMAIEAGCTLIGENKVQEFQQKHAALADLAVERHFIGHLQSNKINDVLKYVSCIQSLDRLDHAEKLNARLQREGRRLDVLVQVNTSAETSKFGLAPEAVIGFVRDLARFDSLNVCGLMTIGLLFTEGERARACLRLLRDLFDRLRSEAIDRVSMDVLSMGMSLDYEQAIEEGSTLVRVGTAVFGKRPTPDGYFWSEKDR
ncbi:MAG TPA: YggS family pyridoxal phosphate-dependent enzyme [Vineibacter sp.]|nr:YggS family pyridoxal phosphate-dependent enzyme [Vineibacter sp.]